MKKIIFFSLLFISSTVHAQWNLVSTSVDDKEKYFVEISSITKFNQYKRVWIKVEYTSDSKMSLSNIRSTRIYFEYDCREKKQRELSFEFFKQPNLIDSTGSSNKQEEWAFIPPNSNFENIFKFVCKSK